MQGLENLNMLQEDTRVYILLKVMSLWCRHGFLNHVHGEHKRLEIVSWLEEIPTCRMGMGATVQDMEPA